MNRVHRTIHDSVTPAPCRNQFLVPRINHQANASRVNGVKLSGLSEWIRNYRFTNLSRTISWSVGETLIMRHRIFSVICPPNGIAPISGTPLEELKRAIEKLPILSDAQVQEKPRW